LYLKHLDILFKKWIWYYRIKQDTYLKSCLYNPKWISCNRCCSSSTRCSYYISTYREL